MPKKDLQLDAAFAAFTGQFELSYSDNDDGTYTVTQTHYGLSEEFNIATLTERTSPRFGLFLNQIRALDEDFKNFLQSFLEQYADTATKEALPNGDIQWTLPHKQLLTDEEHEITFVTSPAGRIKPEDCLKIVDDVFNIDVGHISMPKHLSGELAGEYGFQTELIKTDKGPDKLRITHPFYEDMQLEIPAPQDIISMSRLWAERQDDKSAFDQMAYSYNALTYIIDKIRDLEQDFFKRYIQNSKDYKTHATIFRKKLGGKIYEPKDIKSVPLGGATTLEYVRMGQTVMPLDAIKVKKGNGENNFLVAPDSIEEFRKLVDGLVIAQNVTADAIRGTFALEKPTPSLTPVQKGTGTLPGLGGAPLNPGK